MVTSSDIEAKDETPGCCASGAGRTAWLFGVGIVLIIGVSYVVGPAKLMDMALSNAPSKPGTLFAVFLGLLIAAAMIFPIPIFWLVVPLPGFFFGFWIGFSIVFCAMFGGCTTALFIGQSILQEPIRNFFQQEAYENVHKVLKVIETDEDSFLLFVFWRFMFMPFVVRNYLPSVLDIPLWKLMVSSIPHHLWYSFLGASLGTLLKDTSELLRKGGSVGELSWQQVAPPLVGCIGSVCAAVLAYRMYKRAEAKHADEPSENDRLVGPQRA